MFKIIFINLAIKKEQNKKFKNETSSNIESKIDIVHDVKNEK